ncbi:MULTISPECIES: sensor histidine kinase [Actinomadura]|uniref:Sensor histidine kinase n=1 Tax=Actinomadura yumaensis TaxID=111807 RepID=A0ABW2CUQ4_9ACTN|nr:histidine kinase [Actinomadura sp. J1-007]MWK36317.1 two-component sensor histidine kinase [Actinomadura sp. J1-007]
MGRRAVVGRARPSGGVSAPGRARLVVVTVLGSFAMIYVLAGPSRTDGALPLAASVAATLAVFGLALVWVAPGLARFRGPWPVLAQAVLAYGSVLAFGTSVGLLGFAAGGLLLAFAGARRGPPLAVGAGAAVVASAAAIEAARGSGPAAVTDVTITALLTGLVGYGLVRLADRAADTAAARLPLTMAAVARERLRIAAELNEGLGRGLEAITEGSRRALDRPEEIGAVLDVARRSLADARAAAADFRAMSLAPEAAAARALLAAAGVEAEVRTRHREPLGPAGALLSTVLREAVTEVVRRGTATRCAIETEEDADGAVRLRVSDDGVRTAARGEEGLAEAAARVEAAGGAFAAGLGPDGRFTVEAAVRAGDRPVSVPDRAAYRLSLALLAAVLAGFCVKGLLQVPAAPGGPVAIVALIAVAGALTRWIGSDRPRGRAPILAAQAVLSFAPLLWWPDPVWLGGPGFLAGTLLVALPARAAVPLVAALMAAVGGIAAALSLDPARIANYVMGTLVTALVAYGFVRLARLVRDLRLAGDELARAATVQERLRAARDLHDLLGHSLAAILLKCELARRLAAADPARARAELAEVVEMAGRAGADLRAATGGDPGLSLENEIRSARSVLAAAGVEVTADPAPEPAALPAGASAVLGTVLREAVTNVLRHSAARRCAITVAVDAGAVTLTVENDGVDPGAPRTPPGSGLGNLTTRLAAFDGALTARPDGEGGFRVEASLPSASAPQPVPTPTPAPTRQAT